MISVTLDLHWGKEVGLQIKRDLKIGFEMKTNISYKKNEN